MKSSLNKSRFIFLNRFSAGLNSHRLWSALVQFFLLAHVCTYSLLASATPPIDADALWGRGAQLSLVNPAHLSPNYGRLNLNYDLIIPELNQILDPQDPNNNSPFWGHEFSLGVNLGKRYTIAGSYLSLPYQTLENSTSTFDSRLKLWSLAQAFKLSDRLSVGLSYLNHSDQNWLGGISYGLSSWLLTSVTLGGLDRKALQQGLLNFGLGLKPSERFSLGIQARPFTGGGRLELSSQIRLWRGLHVEFATQANKGVPTEDLTNPLLIYQNISPYNPANDQLSFRFALAWRGLSTWRLEGGTNPQAPARLSLRFESQSSPQFKLNSTKKLIMLNARDSRELSYKSSLFSSAQAHSPFFDTLKKLEEIKADPAAQVVFLLLGGPMAYAQAEELSASIKALRLKGLIVYAYLPQANLANYLVAASCDIIWASPTVELAITGLLSERMYFKNLLDRLNIVPEVITVGDYKSAPEVFLRSEPSKEAAEVDANLLDARFANLITMLAQRAQQQRWAKEPSPSMSKGKRLIALRKLKDSEPLSREDKALAITWLNEGPYGAKHAYDKGLIDKIISPSELEERIKKTHPNLNIEFKELDHPTQTWAPRPQIAVIHASGEIGSGLGLGKSETAITASAYVPLIKRLTYDPLVKGAVLRIDSPGGAVSDADAIWQALKDFAKRKPLAISMGSVAASGGYYIAAPGHMIFANTNTLTGSIGVFAGKVDLSHLLESFGVNIHRQNRGNAISRSLFSPWSDQAKQSLQKELDSIYDLFLTRISSVRKSLDREKLLPLAAGRVWTGEEAKTNGLVDVQGGLIDALKWVSVEADLSNQNYEVHSYAPPKSAIINQVLGALGLTDFAQLFVKNTSLQTNSNQYQSLISQLEQNSQLWWTLFNQLPLNIRFIIQNMILSPNQALAIDPRL